MDHVQDALKAAELQHIKLEEQFKVTRMGLCCWFFLIPHFIMIAESAFYGQVSQWYHDVSGVLKVKSPPPPLPRIRSLMLTIL